MPQKPLIQTPYKNCSLVLNIDVSALFRFTRSNRNLEIPTVSKNGRGNQLIQGWCLVKKIINIWVKIGSSSRLKGISLITYCIYFMRYVSPQ